MRYRATPIKRLLMLLAFPITLAVYLFREALDAAEDMFDDTFGG